MDTQTSARNPAPEVWETPRGSFPSSAAWEITPSRASRWYVHQFRGSRGDTQRTRRLGPLDRDEFALLLWDLKLYEGLATRWERGQGPKPPPIHEYLSPGREHWGELGRLARIAAQGYAENELEPALEEAQLADFREACRGEA